MLYKLTRSILFSFDAESAHHFTLNSLNLVHKLRLDKLRSSMPTLPTKTMGLEFPNPVGLAAGLDKNGEFIDALAALGFGFLEIGTVTPRPQPGNPRPRLFRLKKAQAIINRMGFNNKGIDVLVANVKRARYRGILGINIGKNFDTPNKKAVDDYLACMQKTYHLASYIVINISSPNTKGLRELQNIDELDRLLTAIKEQQLALQNLHQKYVPVAVKVAPDLDHDQLEAMANAFLKHEVDGVIATNTTIARTGVEQHSGSRETGGLSGAPLFAASTNILRQFNDALSAKIPLIGAGGVCSAGDARAKFEAGAQLVQLYTGLIYRGPQLVRDIVQNEHFKRN